MNCAKCQREIQANSSFCYYCGSRQQGAGAAPGPAPFSARYGRGLYRSRTNRVLGGVCGGFAEYLETDPVLVRVVWVLVTLFTGVPLIAYLVAWIVMREAPVSGAAPVEMNPSRRLTRSVRDRRWAGVCGGIAEHFGLDSTAVRLAWAILTVVPGAFIMGFAAYFLAWFIIPQAEYATAPATQPVAHSS
jgi:phage shock protein PspC (stress-responsive transcriptional regulator)